jgi:magnesium-transporting ATPase (P-type)
MALFAAYLLLSGAITVYHYFMHPDHLVKAEQFNVHLPQFVADLFRVPVDYAAKTRIGLSRLAFTLNSFVLAGIFLYNIARFRIKGFTVENQLRMMCSLLIAIGMANVLIISFNFTPFVGFVAIFLALWTEKKGYKLAFLQAILLALTSAGVGCGIFLLRDLFGPEEMKQVFVWTMAACFVVGTVSIISYVITRRRFYSKLGDDKNRVSR